MTILHAKAVLRRNELNVDVCLSVFLHFLCLSRESISRHARFHRLLLGSELNYGPFSSIIHLHC